MNKMSIYFLNFFIFFLKEVIKMALYYRRRRKKFFFFLIFPLLILIIILYIILKISPAFIKLSEDKIYELAFRTINEVISQELEKTDTKNLVDFKYDAEGKIVAVNANISTMNKLNNKISQEISKKLSASEHLIVEIPLGSFLSSHFLSGAGPKIPIQIILLNNVNTEYHTEFSSTGINQTRHRIFITVTCNIGILSSLIKNEQEVKVQIPIAETILVGNVPSTYFDFDNQ